jgi:alkylhydroperoxidase family enzyme
MDRIQGVGDSEAGVLTRLVYRALRRAIGIVPKSKRLAAHHTPTLLAGSWMDAINGGARSVPAVLKELAQLKVAVMAGCPF